MTVTRFTIPAPNLDIAWGGGGDQDRRFRHILAWTLLAVALLSVGITLLSIDKPDRPVYEPVPERIARLMIEARKPPPPPPPPRVEEEPEPEPVAEPEPAVEAEPAPAPEPEPPAATAEAEPPREAARERAARAGVMAFKDVFADLRTGSTLDKLADSGRLSSAGSQATRTERSVLTAGVAKGSGGIDTSGLSRDTGSTRLASRTTAKVEQKRVEEELAETVRQARPDRLGDRTDEEIELVFDRNKSVIYNIYNRALRANPALRGKVVFRLTIAPDGRVTAIDVVSSELEDPSLERKLVLRIKRFEFGSRQVAETTIRYTIDFFPS